MEYLLYLCTRKGLKRYYDYFTSTVAINPR